MDSTRIDFDAENANNTGFTLSDEDMEKMSDNGCLDPDYDPEK